MQLLFSHETRKSFELEFGELFFAEGGKLENPRKTALRLRTGTSNKLDPHIAQGLGFEPRTQLGLNPSFDSKQNYLDIKALM